MDVEDPPQTTARRLEPFHVEKDDSSHDSFNPNARSTSSSNRVAPNDESRRGGSSDSRSQQGKAGTGSGKRFQPKFVKAEETPQRSSDLSSLAGAFLGGAAGSRPVSIDSPASLSQADSLDLMIDDIMHRE